MCENAYLSIKNPKASRAHLRIPAAECSLHSRDSALLHRQLSASEAGVPPLTKSWIRTWSVYLEVQFTFLSKT